MYGYGQRDFFTLPNLLLAADFILPFLLTTFFATLFVKCPPPDRRRAGYLLLAATLIASLAGISIYADSRAGGRLFAVVVTVFILLAAISGGLRLLTWLLPPTTSQLTLGERFVIAWGLGMGTLSLAVFLLGETGLIGKSHPWSAVVLLLLFFSSGIRPLIQAGKNAPATIEKAWDGFGWLAWGGLGFCLLHAVLLLPLTFLPPLEYDVLEYHLQLPKEYFNAGAITFLPHNTFSGFPQGMEMFSLLGFQLMGETVGKSVAASQGIWLARLLNFSFYPLLLLSGVLSVRRILGREHSRGWDAGWFAAVGMLACSRSLTFSHLLYNELELGTYTILALLGATLIWRSEKTSHLRLAILVGGFAGLAAGVKYPGLIFVGLPLTGLVFFLPPSGVSTRRRLLLALLVGAVCWLLLAPWLLKNFISTGNPFYPLWNQAFGVDFWSPTQEIRFQRAHHKTDASAVMMLQAGVRYLWQLVIGGNATIFGRTVNGIELGGMGFFFISGLLCARKKETAWRVILLVGWLVFIFLCWFFLTHRIERFFYPGYLLACVLSAVGAGMLLRESTSDSTAGEKNGSRLPTALLACVLLIACLRQGILVTSFYSPPPSADKKNATIISDVALGRVPPEKLLARYHPAWRLRQVLAKMPGEKKVLMIGEARAFWLPKGTAYAVVFAQHPLFQLLKECSSAAEVREKLRARGITHLYINWHELVRLHATYYKAYSLTPAEQQRLYELLSRETIYLPLARRWRLPLVATQVGRERYAKLLRDWKFFFAADHPLAAQAPYELYKLR